MTQLLLSGLVMGFGFAWGGALFAIARAGLHSLWTAILRLN
ncbi:MAG: hypothetical protein GAK35_02299 [Herbaspirillum frisingense]|uniref:Uncharacterized protein n=1 Tax=Herbaspirillum frisingense TaxID=92645 RepID=A0A7V8FWC4_9BURK|nr:MAG: hypothetical protein GAK35_02299 [Herbaspirillum frisingense]